MVSSATERSQVVSRHTVLSWHGLGSCEVGFVLLWRRHPAIRTCFENNEGAYTFSPKGMRTPRRSLGRPRETSRVKSIFVRIFALHEHCPRPRIVTSSAVRKSEFVNMSNPAKTTKNTDAFCSWLGVGALILLWKQETLNRSKYL
jgi:hypothetical protein